MCSVFVIMERLVTLAAVLAFVSVCHTTPQNSATVVIDGGNVGIGLINGGTFGPGSFSIGSHGSSRREQTHVYVKEDSGGDHIFIHATNHKGQQDNNRRHQYDKAEPNNSGGTNSGHTQLFPVKPLTTLVNTGQGDMPGQGGSGGGIVIGAVVLPNDTYKGNKVNKQPDALDASGIEAIYAGNGENNGFYSTGVSFSSGGSLAIGAITGGNFGEETLSLNKKPEANVSSQQSATDNGDIGFQNTGNEATFSIGHGVNSPVNMNAGVGNNHGQNKGNKHFIVLNSGGTSGSGGQGSVAIGVITGGHFGEGTLSLNNKRPGANVPQQQINVNNENIGHHNTENETPRSKEHGAKSNGNGNAEVGKNHGQSSTGYNAYNNEEPWVWYR